MQAKSKAKVRFIIKDVVKVPLTMGTLNRIRSTKIHVQKLANFHSLVTIRGVRTLRTFSDNTGNTVVVQEVTLKMNTSDIVLSQCSLSSFHTKMTKAPMPEHRIKFKTREGRFQDRRQRNRRSRRESMSQESSWRNSRNKRRKFQLKKWQVICNSSNKFKPR